MYRWSAFLHSHSQTARRTSSMRYWLQRTRISTFPQDEWNDCRVHANSLQSGLEHEMIYWTVHWSAAMSDWSQSTCASLWGNSSAVRPEQLCACNSKAVSCGRSYLTSDANLGTFNMRIRKNVSEIHICRERRVWNLDTQMKSLTDLIQDNACSWSILALVNDPCDVT